MESALVASEPPILLLSSNELDQEVVGRFAQSLGTTVFATTDRDEAWAFLVRVPGATVIWDVDDASHADVMSVLIATAATVSRVLAVGSQPIFAYPMLFQSMCFAHFFNRTPQYLDHSLLQNVLRNARGSLPFGVASYFPQGTRVQSIVLKASGEKIAAVEAVLSFLTKIGISERVASLAAQGADELLMNAIFDAPINGDGGRFRKPLDRASLFNLDPTENVTLEVAATDDYAGIAVRDSYGSFGRETLLRFLGKNYSTGKYTVWKNDPGAGLGIYNLVHSGMSLVFLSQPGVRTETHLYFRNCKRYKEFRESFRFVSVLLPQ